MMQMRSNWLLIAALALLAGLAACAAQPAATGPQIRVEEAWGRPSPQMATAGAFYMIIRNTGDEADRLLGGRSPACGAVELHESYQAGEGVMGMRPVAGGVEAPAGGQVELKPGGRHIMCIDKLADFQPGARLSLTLQFEQSGEQTVEVEIREP